MASIIQVYVAAWEFKPAAAAAAVRATEAVAAPAIAAAAVGC